MSLTEFSVPLLLEGLILVKTRFVRSFYVLGNR